jgi:hypothetical protein
LSEKDQNCENLKEELNNARLRIHNLKIEYDNKLNEIKVFNRILYFFKIELSFKFQGNKRRDGFE